MSMVLSLVADAVLMDLVNSIVAFILGLLGI
jgi:hypothetical protein